jgi:hypothetical protein
MAEERLPVGEARQGVSELPPRLAQERQGVCQEGQHPWIFHVLGGTGEAMKRCQGYFLLYFNLFLLIALAEDGTARGTVASQGERHADARLLWRRSRRGRYAASHQQHHGQRTHAGKQRLAQIFESQLFDDASYLQPSFFLRVSAPLCRVCMVNEADTIILPCGHFCMCGECAARSSKDGICPICRVPIRMYFKVYVDWN